MVALEETKGYNVWFAKSISLFGVLLLTMREDTLSPKGLKVFIYIYPVQILSMLEAYYYKTNSNKTWDLSNFCAEKRQKKHPKINTQIQCCFSVSWHFLLFRKKSTITFECSMVTVRWECSATANCSLLCHHVYSSDVCLEDVTIQKPIIVY